LFESLNGIYVIKGFFVFVNLLGGFGSHHFSNLLL
jgi:hypothetical protein